MPGIWFGTALSAGDEEAAWELYHENAKRGRRAAPASRRYPSSRPAYHRYPALRLGPGAEGPGHIAAGALAPAVLAALLAAGGRRFDEADPVETFVLVNAVTGLPRGLCHYDEADGTLRLFRRVEPAEVTAALVEPERAAARAVLIVFAADLGAAAGRSGERGYREALIAVGRHIEAVSRAAAAAAIPFDDGIRFYDRDLDALLFLDGLSRSAFAAAAAG